MEIINNQTTKIENQTRSKKSIAIECSKARGFSEVFSDRRERYSNGEKVITIAGVYCRCD